MHTLPPLPYDYNALEPYMDEQTVRIHHDKHHQAYVMNLNKSLETHPELFKLALNDLLKKLNDVPEDIRSAVKNHGGGVWNHNFFWEILGPQEHPKEDEPDSAIPQKIYSIIEKDFGSFEQFKEQFKAAAMGRFGSGWAWLITSKTGKLSIVSTANQDCPLSDGHTPLLCIDVWEHSYYLKYQNRRADYVDAFWNIVNWKKVEENYETRNN